MLIQNDQVCQIINQGSLFVGNCSLVFHGTKFSRHDYAFFILAKSMGVLSMLLPDLFKVLHVFNHNCFAESFLQIVKLWWLID